MQNITIFFSSIGTEKCPIGKFYNRKTSHCQLCPKSTYQSESGQDFCIDCPGGTSADTEGATSVDNCKGKSLTRQCYEFLLLDLTLLPLDRNSYTYRHIYCLQIIWKLSPQ